MSFMHHLSTGSDQEKPIIDLSFYPTGVKMRGAPSESALREEFPAKLGRSATILRWFACKIPKLARRDT